MLRKVLWLVTAAAAGCVRQQAGRPRPAAAVAPQLPVVAAAAAAAVEPARLGCRGAAGGAAGGPRLAPAGSCRLAAHQAAAAGAAAARAAPALACLLLVRPPAAAADQCGQSQAGRGARDGRQAGPQLRAGPRQQLHAVGRLLLRSRALRLSHQAAGPAALARAPADCSRLASRTASATSARRAARASCRRQRCARREPEERASITEERVRLPHQAQASRQAAARHLLPPASFHAPPASCPAQ